MINGEEVNGIGQNMSEPVSGAIMPQELNEETKAWRRGVSAFYKGTIVAIAVLGLFLILLGYSIGSELVNTASHCPNNRPCLLISPDFGGFSLALFGGYLILLSLSSFGSCETGSLQLPMDHSDLQWTVPALSTM